MNDNAGRGPDASGFSKLINRHGYPFQYRTLSEARKAFEDRVSGWVFEAAEFPVAVRGQTTRIDYILKWPRLGWYLIVECKRANPRMKHWCFAKAPFVRRNEKRGYILSEHITLNEEDNSVYAVLNRESMPGGCEDYHVAREMKVTTETGDKSGNSDDIENAATQVLKGLNGFVQFFYENLGNPMDMRALTLFPIIVTTAELFAVDVDLAAGNIETGEIEQPCNLTPKEWVFYQYPVTPGIKHNVPARAQGPDESVGFDVSESLESEYLRTIGVVQGKHFTKFLHLLGRSLFPLQAPM